MDLLEYKTFDSSNSDIAYDATNGYTTPANEEAVRKQLSYPLKEVKTFVNNTVSVKDVSGSYKAVQLVLSSTGKLQYRTEPTGELQDLRTEEQKNYSFVGMVVMGTNLTTEASVKAIYGADTSWTLLSSVILGSNHVYGNGKSLALYNGNTSNTLYGLRSYIGETTIISLGYSTAYGQDVSTTQPSGGSNAYGIMGVPTKEKLGSSNLDKSGLIVDTKTVYTWERTA